MQKFIPKQFSDNNQTKSLSPREALDYCDFILFSPQALPREATLISEQMRCEINTAAVGTHRFEGASYRQEYQLTERTRFSIKQFCYYWAPIAYDHPCLWLNHSISDLTTTPPARPTLIENNILWVGTDFRGKASATMTIERTTIELTVIEGYMNSSDIEQVFKSLRIVDIAQADRIRGLRFSEQCYIGRYDNVMPTKVPTCYWKHERVENEVITAISPESQLFQHLPCTIPDLAFHKYHLDSVFIIGDLKSPTEIEFKYEHDDFFGIDLRLLYTPNTSRHPIKYPPSVDNQRCDKELFNVEGQELVYIASSQYHDLGSHAAVFRLPHDAGTCILISKPAPWTDKSWIKKLCEQVIHSLQINSLDFHL